MLLRASTTTIAAVARAALRRPCGNHVLRTAPTARWLSTDSTDESSPSSSSSNAHEASVLPTHIKFRMPDLDFEVRTHANQSWALADALTHRSLSLATAHLGRQRRRDAHQVARAGGRRSEGRRADVRGALSLTQSSRTLVITLTPATVRDATDRYARSQLRPRVGRRGLHRKDLYVSLALLHLLLTDRLTSRFALRQSCQKARRT